MARSAFTVLVALVALTQVQGYFFSSYYPQEEYDVYDVQITQPSYYQQGGQSYDEQVNLVEDAVARAYEAACDEVEESHQEAIQVSQQARSTLENMARQVQQSICTMNLYEIQQGLSECADPRDFSNCATQVLNNGMSTAQEYMDTAYQCIIEADAVRQQCTDSCTARLEEANSEAQQYLDYYCQMLNACAYSPYGCGQTLEQLQCLAEEQATAFNAVLTPLTAAEDLHQNTVTACLAVAQEAQQCLRDDIVQQVSFC